MCVCVRACVRVCSLTTYDMVGACVCQCVCVCESVRARVRLCVMLHSLRKIDRMKQLVFLKRKKTKKYQKIN